MFFKSKSAENSFQTKDPVVLIALGTLMLFVSSVFCALDGASLSSSLSFGLILLLNVPVYASLFRYEPDFKKSSECHISDFELYRLSGFEVISPRLQRVSQSQTQLPDTEDMHTDSHNTEYSACCDGNFSDEHNKRDKYLSIAADNVTDRLFIGYGYEFLPKHARALAKLQEHGLKQLPNGKGSVQIHNLNRHHKPLFMSLQNIKDHAVIFGTTGSGKTRFFDLLITQAIARNDTVIIIDPKGDHDLKRRAHRICNSCHREDAFHVLDIKDPKFTSTPFNLFGSSVGSSDIADKLSALMKKSTFDTDSFASYGQEAVACAVTALDCLDLPVDIYNICSHANIESYFEGMVAGLSKLTAKAQNRDIALYFLKLLKGYGLEKHLYHHTKDFFTDIGDEALFEETVNADPDVLTCMEQDFTLTAKTITENEVSGTKAQSLNDSNVKIADHKTEITYEEQSSVSTDDSKSCEEKAKPKRRSRVSKIKTEEPSSVSTEKVQNKKTTAKKKTSKAKNCKVQVKAAAFLAYYRYLKQQANLDADPEFEKLVSMTVKDQSFFDRTTASIKTVLNTLNSYDLKQVLSKNGRQTDFSDIYQKNRVFYCALHSMSNATLSSYVGKLLLSDLSSFADYIYSMDGNSNALDTDCSNDKFYSFDALLSKVDKDDGLNDSAPHFTKVNDGQNSYAETPDPDAQAALLLTDSIVNLDEVNRLIDKRHKQKEQKQLRYKARNPGSDMVKTILHGRDPGRIHTRRKVSIFIDEASEVANEALLQLLNKARGADFSITIATQTFSDLVKRCGSKDAAMQLIGNCNTMYALRVKDEQTAQIITSALPNTTFYTKNVSTGAMADTYKESYRESSSIAATSYIDRIFPSSALMELPNFEYVAKLSDGRFVKGVIPVLSDS